MGIARPKLFLILSYEATVFASSFLLVRKVYGGIIQANEELSRRMILILVLFFAAYFYLMWRDLYSRNYHYYLRKTYRVVLKNTTLSVLLVLAVMAVLSGIERSRVLPALIVYLPVGALSFFVVHGSHFLWIRYLSHIGYFRRNCLVVGTPHDRLHPEVFFQDIGNTKNYVGSIRRANGAWEYHSKFKPWPRRLKNLQDIKAAILKENIGEVLFFHGDGVREKALRELADFCHSVAIGYFLVPEPSRLTRERPWTRILEPLPALEQFLGNRDSLTNISLKRLLDMLVSAASLLLFLPIGLLIALAIKLEDNGPVFYVAPRIGKNGRPMRFYKFRTMVVGADKQKSRLLQFNQRGDGPLFKMENDPRVTRVGRILRRHSLDEFPQMLNVLQGTMSLVGPRPHLPEEVAAYRGDDYLRLECIPGIVCLPQIIGRNTLGFKEWVSMDLEYRRNWSLSQDIKIIAKTVRIVLASFFRPRGSGF